jgi:hypothetical protein
MELMVTHELQGTRTMFVTERQSARLDPHCWALMGAPSAARVDDHSLTHVTALCDPHHRRHLVGM